MSIQKDITDVSRILPLSSVERVLFHIDPDNSLGTTVTAQRRVLPWIYSISNSVYKYLCRELYIKDRVEYFDTIKNKYEYPTSAYPIWSIGSVYVDQTGHFDGSESIIDSEYYYITTAQDGVVVDSTEFLDTKRALKVTYSAGLAYHPLNSVYEAINSFTVDNYIIGSTTGSIGRVVAASGTSVTLEVLTGVYEAGEALTEYISLTLEETTGETSTLDTVTSRALVETYPDIVEAVEMQIRYMYQHKDDFENSGTNREGETIRRSDGSPSKLQAEVRLLLDPYRRLSMLG